MYQQEQDFEHEHSSPEHETQYREYMSQYDHDASNHGNRHAHNVAQGFTYSTNPTSLSSSLLAILSYLFLWPGALILLLFVRKNRFVRFHALQSLLFFGAVNIIYIVFLRGVTHWPLPHLFWVIPLLVFLGVNIIAFIAWIVGIVGALRGDYVHLPFVGEFAAQHIME